MIATDSVFFTDEEKDIPAGGGKRLFFFFNSFDFANSEQNTFRYRLLPFEEEWRSATKESSANYTNLPGELYTFELQSGNNSGEWSESTAYVFNIKKKFRETIWFDVLILIGTLILIFVVRQSSLKVVKANEKRLQIRVEERTKEVLKQKNKIEEQNEELEQAIQNLKDAQTQLVHSEKMASLGQLTAGVAHEINNPVNFISGGVEALAAIISDIIELLTTYETIDHAQLAEVEAIQQKIILLKKELSYTEIIEDAQQMLEDIKIGTRRTTEIVIGLKNFSRSDESKFSDTNVHDCLDATLTILRNQYKDRIEIQKSYDPDLPLVNCKAGQINQVFMNIISNATQAIQEKGEITIKTSHSKEDQIVSIQISDTGNGIPAHIKSKIFDPFFTTKSVGKGTGLGLSISHGIIKDHQGNITVESQEGYGTTFTIELPLNPQRNAK